MAALVRVDLFFTTFAHLELEVEHKYSRCVIACVSWTSGYTSLGTPSQLHIRWDSDRTTWGLVNSEPPQDLR